MGEMTRTFIAVEIPEPTREAIVQLQRGLRDEAPNIRWTAPESLHLTLAFLGDVPSGDLDRLCDAVGESVRTSPRFSLEVQGLGAFPTSKRARVLWAGVIGDDLPALGDLQRAVVSATTEAGHPPADDRFHPHITIARSKAGRDPSPDLSTICERYRQWRAGSLPIGEVVAIASELTPKVPIYRVLRSLPMAETSA